MSPTDLGSAKAGSGAIVLALIGIAFMLIAVMGDDFLLRFAAEVLLIGTAVMSLNFLIGLGGLVSLGHAAIFGIAAYAAAILAPSIDANVIGLLAAGMAASLAMACVMALISLRSSGLFFLVLTLVIGQMTWELAFRWRDLTGGADGLRGFPKPALGAWPLSSAHSLYITAAIIALVSWLFLNRIKTAPLGQAITGMRDQPLRMTALGYSLGRLRILAFLVTGATTGAAGALYPFVNQYIGPNVVHWSLSATFIIMGVLGGIRSLGGAYAGAALYLTIQTYLSSYTDRWQLIIGVLFVVTVLFMPHGIIDTLKDRRTS